MKRYEAGWWAPDQHKTLTVWSLAKAVGWSLLGFWLFVLIVAWILGPVS